MLGKTLAFVEKVKNSPVGQLFFRKNLKEVDQDMRRLDDGNEIGEK